MNETLRVNGRASMTTDPALLEQLVAQGKPPVAACRVAIEEVFLHCAKALVRSKLWDSDRHMDRAEFPPLGHMIAEQIGADDRDGAEAMVQDSLRNRLYYRLSGRSRMVLAPPTPSPAAVGYTWSQI